jgi:DNA transformation protein
MAIDPSFRDAVTFRLSPMGPVVARGMFGGAGIFLDGLMFGLIVGDALYLKADGETELAFEEAGSEPFTYLRAGAPATLGYWRVPEEVWDDGAALLRWSGDALGVAKRAAVAKRPKKKRRAP